MKKITQLLSTIAVVITVINCDPGHLQNLSNNGEVAVNIIPSALSVSDVARVHVIISGQDISPDIETDLAGSPEEGWSGLITDIPAGTDRTFSAFAYDDEDVAIYVGAASDVVISTGKTTSVTLYLQQTAPPDRFENAVPAITSLVVSPMTVFSEDDVTLRVAAADTDPDDQLTFEWTATDGLLSDDDVPCTQWTAPTLPGIYDITVSVTDLSGAAAELTAEITVIEAVGDANVDIAINSTPIVQSLIPAPTRIDIGESTQLSLVTLDPEGDALTFDWQSSCDGSFNDPNAMAPIFTLNTLNDDVCTLTVAIDDGQGGTNQAEITIRTGPEIIPQDLPPNCGGVLEFQDPVLEDHVRDAIDKPEGDLYFEDVSPITQLSIYKEGFSNLEGIQCLINLQNLRIVSSGTDRLSDISPLSRLTDLTLLDIGDNDISDISTLSNLINLTSLSIGNSNISDISALSQLTGLKKLTITGNLITDISAISGLTNLKKCSITGNLITDISAISGLTNLTSLSISGNGITAITELSTLLNLDTLTLTNTGVETLQGIERLVKLTKISMSKNKISDISAIADLINLRTIMLSDNEFTDISPLSELTSVKYLYLDNNDITDISAIADLAELRMLALNENELIDISVLSELTNLQILYLKDNNIIDISPLSELPTLSTIFLNNNSITDISPLVANPDIGQGDNVYLQGNPLDCEDTETEENITALSERGARVYSDCTY